MCVMGAAKQDCYLLLVGARNVAADEQPQQVLLRGVAAPVARAIVCAMRSDTQSASKGRLLPLKKSKKTRVSEKSLNKFFDFLDF
jgi:hypothetical protein